VEPSTVRRKGCLVAVARASATVKGEGAAVVLRLAVLVHVFLRDRGAGAGGTVIVELHWFAIDAGIGAHIVGAVIGVAAESSSVNGVHA